MASSDKMREVFGKILAGEIVSPGSFSVTTLRIVSELDQKTARKFQELCLRRFGERFIVKFEEDLKGQTLIDLYGLEERGLLKEVGGYTNIDLSKNDEGFYDLDDGSWRLRMVIEPINEFIPVSTRVSTMLFTSSGIQLASLLQNSHTEGLRSVARIQTKREAVKFIELGNVVEGTFTSVEIILDRRMSSGQDVDI